MPPLRVGRIPEVRLSSARKVRDQLKEILGTTVSVLVSISKSDYCVCINGPLPQGVTVPRVIDGVAVKIKRSKSD
jgi:hypothetical protein